MTLQRYKKIPKTPNVYPVFFAATTVCLFFGYLDGATTISESCGGGGGNNELPKKKDNEDELSFARRCHQMAKAMHAPRYRLRRG